MKLSCIMTTFNDGALIRQSVQSVLNQSYEDFELIIVDDGSQETTRAILAELDDPRIRILPQANDGLSSARNRGLHNANGDYICFLDADDTRAPWAFASVAEAIEITGAELLLTRGVLSQERSQLIPFFDDSHFTGYAAERAELPDAPGAALACAKAWATSLEPQSANKFISRAVIERGKLRFPNDHFYEDILFHSLAIAHARSVELLPIRSFTYFQRQLRPQLTGSNGQIRFDILGTARVTFQLFQAHPDFSNPRQRSALALSALRLLRWCEDCIPTFHRHAFRVALREVLKSVSPLYFAISDNTPAPRGDSHALLNYAKEVLA